MRTQTAVFCLLVSLSWLLAPTYSLALSLQESAASWSEWTWVAAQRLTFIFPGQNQKWVGDGWKNRSGKMIGADLWLIYKAWGKKILLIWLSQKGNDGLPSLKWHSHVLPAVISHWNLRGMLKRKTAEKKKIQLSFSEVYFFPLHHETRWADWI